jgi:hypothetical protein
MKTVMVLVAVVLLGGCRMGPTNPTKTERVDRSKRTVIDAGEYIDFTINKHNANMFKKEDILYKSDGTFQLEGSNSYIKIDRAKGRITINTDRAMNIPGKQFYADYSFDVAAASDDCLYIRLVDKTGATLITDDKIYKNEEVPDLLVCLPLYGFGINRFEVSSVMNGYIGMPSGTYWKK